MVKNFGERLRELRKEKDITLEGMAKELNTTQATLSRYETGKRIPDMAFLNLLSNYFKVSTDYLIGKSNNRNPVIYKETDKYIEELREKVAKYGYDISDKTDEEVAKMIIKAIKFDELTKL